MMRERGWKGGMEIKNEEVRVCMYNVCYFAFNEMRRINVKYEKTFKHAPFLI